MKSLGGQVAKYDIGVGDCRLLAAQIVGGGTGHAARAFRADLDPPSGGIEAGDGAAARADRARLQH